MRTIKKSAIPTEQGSAGRTFSGRGPLGPGLLAHAAAAAASVVMALSSPAAAEEATRAERAGKCTAVLVDGPIVEPFSFSSKGASITELVVRFPDSSSPAKERHVELVLRGPFDRSHLRETLLRSMLASGDALRGSGTASFDCGTSAGSVVAARPPANGTAPPVKTEPVPPVQPGSKTAGPSEDVPPVKAQQDAKTEPPVQEPSGPSLDELRGQAGEKIADIRSLVDRAKSLGITGSHVRAAGRAHDALKSAAKRSDSAKLQSAISGADEATVPLKAAVREAEKTLITDSLKLAGDIEKMSADSRLKQESRGSLSALAARIKGESEREPLDVNALKLARRDASSMMSRADAEIAAALKRMEAESRDRRDMTRCKGDASISILGGRGPAEAYKIALPLTIKLETSSGPGKAPEHYALRIKLELDVHGLMPARIESTAAKATKLVRAEIEDRCPSVASESLDVAMLGVPSSVRGAKNLAIDYFDSGVEGASPGERKVFLEARALLAGRSKAEEEAAKQRALEKAGRR